MKNKIYLKLKICVFLIVCVLIIGLGGAKASAATNEAPASLGKWTMMASMKDSRGGFQSEVVNGKIYVMGGKSQNGVVLSSVEEYDPSTNTWTTLASMKQPRWYFTSEVVDGKIYVMGGLNKTALSSVEVYDPLTNTWTTVASMKYCWKEIKSGVINGNIYVRGENGSSLERYDPSTNTWTELGSMKQCQPGSELKIINDEIYAIGGKFINCLSTLEKYDLSTNTWTELASMKNCRYGFRSEVINDKIYVINGNGKDDYLSSVEEYDQLTNTWTELASTKDARYNFQSQIINGKIYIMGGVHNGYLSSVEEYDPLTNKWITLASMKEGRSAFKSEVIKGKLYVIGGFGNSNVLSSVERFDSSDTSTITLNKTTASIKVGDTDTLTAITTPSNTGVTWKSSDPTIATVDSNGVVNGIKAGTVTITVTTSDGKTAFCTVTVTEPIEPTTISLNKTSDLIEAGKGDTLTAVVNPSNAGVTWSSSDNSIVTVDENGKIIGKKAGTAVITATTADGKTASCTVTVKDEEEDRAKLTLYMNDTTIREFYVTQDELDDFIDWYTSKSKGEVTVKPYYVFNVPSKTSSRIKKSYIPFFKIESFEVE